jgi:hypothetical protein
MFRERCIDAATEVEDTEKWRHEIEEINMAAT